jgi:spore germination protein KB
MQIANEWKSFGEDKADKEVIGRMRIKPFGILPAIFIMILSVGLVNHVLVVPMLLSAARRDAWLCELAALCIALLWVAFPLYGVSKRLERRRFDAWLQELMPALLAKAVTGIFLVFLLLSGFETLIITASWTATTYLPNTPPMVVCGVFLALCLFAAYSGLRTIAYASCILLPFVVLLGDFVMSVNMPHKDYRFLLPMLEHGFSPIVTGMFYALTALSELYALLFFQHHVSRPFKRWQLVTLVLFLALLAVGPATGAISEFGPVEAEKMRYPAFSQWRLVSIGKYIEHVDFFAVFQWLSGAMVRLSLSIHILSEFGASKRFKPGWLLPAALALIYLAGSYYGINRLMHYHKLLLWCFANFGIIIMSIVSGLWLLAVIRGRYKRDRKGEERLG